MFANQTSAQVVGDPQFNTNFTISGFPQVVSAYTIYPFDGTNGAVGITDGLTYFTNGLLYGETGGGGNGMAYGTVFSIFPGAVSGQAPSVIYYFHPLWGQNFGFSDNDGQNPTGPLVFGWDYPVVDCSVEQVQRSDTEGWFTKTNIIYSSTPKPALFGTTVFGGKHGMVQYSELMTLALPAMDLCVVVFIGKYIMTLLFAMIILYLVLLEVPLLGWSMSTIHSLD